MTTSKYNNNNSLSDHFQEHYTCTDRLSPGTCNDPVVPTVPSIFVAVHVYDPASSANETTVICS